jgi:hypothetical protein
MFSCFAEEFVRMGVVGTGLTKPTEPTEGD